MLFGSIPEVRVLGRPHMHGARSAPDIDLASDQETRDHAILANYRRNVPYCDVSGHYAGYDPVLWGQALKASRAVQAVLKARAILLVALIALWTVGAGLHHAPESQTLTIEVADIASHHTSKENGDTSVSGRLDHCCSGSSCLALLPRAGSNLSSVDCEISSSSPLVAAATATTNRLERPPRPA